MYSCSTSHNRSVTFKAYFVPGGGGFWVLGLCGLIAQTQKLSPNTEIDFHITSFPFSKLGSEPQDDSVRIFQINTDHLLHVCIQFIRFCLNTCRHSVYWVPFEQSLSYLFVFVTFFRCVYVLSFSIQTEILTLLEFPGKNPPITVAGWD